MITHLVTVRHRRRNGRWLRLYVPVMPVLLMLSPLLLLAMSAGLVDASPPVGGAVTMAVHHGLIRKVAPDSFHQRGAQRAA